jgi:hypothetical protein
VKLTSALILIGLLPFAANATLGEQDTTVDRDRQALGASHKLVQKSNYSVHELNANGNTIREYVRPDGVVFGVSWRGIKRPDLSAIFGAYYDEYKTASDAQPPVIGRQPVTVTTSKIVVHRGGHMRDIHGQAFVPDLVPSNVNTEELQ